jgi:hypothetical protein
VCPSPSCWPEAEGRAVGGTLRRGAKDASKVMREAAKGSMQMGVLG